MTHELVVDFLSIILYYRGMILGINKMKFRLSGIAVLAFYSISIALIPLFHLHPGEHHPGSINTGYHSHTEPFATHTSEHSENDNPEDATPHHFGETITPFEDMVGVVQVHSGNMFYPAKFSPVLVLFIQSSSEPCQSQVSKQNTLSLLSPHPQRDYSVLTSTNLSPPQA